MAGSSIYLPKRDLWEGGDDYSGAVLTGAGTKIFTVPDNVSRVLITMCAGGGGGGPGIYGANATVSGGGGSGGEVVEFWYDVPPSKTLSFNIGAGGAGGTPFSGSTNPDQGGTTTFFNTGLAVIGGLPGVLGGPNSGNGAGGGPNNVETTWGGSARGGSSRFGLNSAGGGLPGDPQFDGDQGFGSPYAAGGVGGEGVGDMRGGGGGGAAIGPGGAGGNGTNFNSFGVTSTPGSNGVNGGGGGGGGGNGGGASDVGANGGDGGDGAVIIRWITNELY